jgi:hypothetical protein
VAEYAKAWGIDTEPAFAWWVSSDQVAQSTSGVIISHPRSPSNLCSSPGCHWEFLVVTSTASPKGRNSDDSFSLTSYQSLLFLVLFHQYLVCTRPFCLPVIFLDCP